MINLTGETEFDASREMLWEMILDPDILARILPGCNELVIVNENEYQGQMKIKIGPVDGVFRGTVALSELQPPEKFHLVVNGRGPSGVVEGEGDVQLLDSGNGGTMFGYGGTGQISGRMASVGQRVMTSSAKAVVKQSLENLDKQVQARLQPETPPDEASASTKGAGPAAEIEAPPPPSQTEFMMGVAENMLEEFVPDPAQRRALAGIAVVALLVFFMNWFANLVARRVVAMMDED